jgi:hypothetical protein
VRKHLLVIQTMVSVAAIIALASTSDAQSFADSFRNQLPHNGREMVCPHRAASALVDFWQKDSAVAMAGAKSLYAGKANKRWSYMRTGSASVPTLKEDGSTLDFTHRNVADFVAYVPRNGQVQKAFWSHRFNDQEVISAGNNLVAEGDDNLIDIRAEIRASDFCVIQTGEFRSKTELKDAIWTNTIFVKDSNAPKSADLVEFQRINERLLDSLPPKDAHKLTDPNTTFVTTATSSTGENYVTVFRGADAARFGHLVGELYSFKTDADPSLAALMESLQLQSKGRLYVYGGDVPKVDFSKLASDRELTLIRRGPSVIKNFIQTDRQLTELASRSLEKETTVALNGIPGSEEELKSMNKPSGAVDTWKTFKLDIAEKIAPHVSGKIETRDELFRELQSGTNDVLFLFAHFDGKALFFGNERVELKELEALRTTRDSSRPRVAVLMACNAGRLSSEARSFFRRGVDSLGELLIRKHFFEKVIAPDHEIESTESLGALTAYLSTSKISQKGWLTLADSKPHRAILR